MATGDSEPQYCIRAARYEDIDRLREIEQKASEMFLGTPHSLVARLPCMAPVFLAEQIKEKRVWTACTSDGVPVGFAVALIADGEAHLNELSVDPAHGRKGIGRQLIENVCEWARSARHTSISLSTFRDIDWNAPFYSRLGFVEVPEDLLGPEIKQFRENERNAGLDLNSRIIMRKALIGREFRRNISFKHHLLSRYRMLEPEPVGVQAQP